MASRSLGPSGQREGSNPSPRAMKGKPTLAMLRPLTRAYLAENWNGGPLHITLVDHNMEQDFLKFCHARATEAGDADALLIVEMMMEMTARQRRRWASHH